MPKINQKNFAINGRCYNSANTRTFLDSSLYNKTADLKTGFAPSLNMFTSTLAINPDTALGQSWFHENRYLGKAAFVYSF